MDKDNLPVTCCVGTYICVCVGGLVSLLIAVTEAAQRGKCLFSPAWSKRHSSRCEKHLAMLHAQAGIRVWWVLAEILFFLSIQPRRTPCLYVRWLFPAQLNLSRDTRKGQWISSEILNQVDLAKVSQQRDRSMASVVNWKQGQGRRRKKGCLLPLWRAGQRRRKESIG